MDRWHAVRNGSDGQELKFWKRRHYPGKMGKGVDGPASGQQKVQAEADTEVQDKSSQHTSGNASPEQVRRIYQQQDRGHGVIDNDQDAVQGRPGDPPANPVSRRAEGPIGLV